MATSSTFWKVVLRGASRASLNLFDRASELETAAATPSSINRVIRISDCVICVTLLIYAATASILSTGSHHPQREASIPPK